jgi:hypothetical protein
MHNSNISTAYWLNLCFSSFLRIAKTPSAPFWKNVLFRSSKDSEKEERKTLENV